MVVRFESDRGPVAQRSEQRTHNPRRTRRRWTTITDESRRSRQAMRFCAALGVPRPHGSVSRFQDVWARNGPEAGRARRPDGRSTWKYPSPYLTVAEAASFLASRIPGPRIGHLRSRSGIYPGRGRRWSPLRQRSQGRRTRLNPGAFRGAAVRATTIYPPPRRPNRIPVLLCAAPPPHRVRRLRSGTYV